MDKSKLRDYEKVEEFLEIQTTKCLIDYHLGFVGESWAAKLKEKYKNWEIEEDILLLVREVNILDFRIKTFAAQYEKHIETLLAYIGICIKFQLKHNVKAITFHRYIIRQYIMRNDEMHGLIPRLNLADSVLTINGSLHCFVMLKEQALDKMNGVVEACEDISERLNPAITALDETLLRTYDKLSVKINTFISYS